VGSGSPVALWSATPQQKTALIRLLVKELRVMSREEIRPTYTIPALVRTEQSSGLEGSVREPADPGTYSFPLPGLTG
jgi:hypothetical protein